MRIKYLLTLLVAGGLASAAIANPYETTLKNGLRVIVKEDRRAPTAVQMVWYRIGSMDEVDGASGVAHVLEHMMFKGTPSVGPGEFNKRVAAAGGKDNAFTSRDYTAYFQQIPKEKLADMMALEADRMRHLNVDAKEFEQEIKVVMEERRMRTDDNPQAKLFEQMNAAAFQAHPYRRPIIGWMNDLENMTAADAKAWYDTWYVPNNAYVVITGDVDHKTVFALAEQHYGPLEGRALPVRRQQIEPKQEGTRRVTVKAPAELPVLIMGYKAPILRDVEQDSDPYALEMLAAILDGHDAARFNKKLVREDKVALSVGTVPGSPTPASEMLRRGAAGLGWRHSEIPRWMAYPPGGDAVTGKRQSMTRTYLPRAFAAGARMVVNCRVDRLTRADARPKQVALLGIDPKPREKQIKIEGT